MSEYQRYEFQAIDRPLTPGEQATLRRCSSRATITASRFAVDYSWGSFKGDVDAWMERYFDAFLYVAGWGARELSFGLPRNLLPLEVARRYCAGDGVSARAKGERVIVALRSENEEGGEWIAEDDHPLASVLPVRDELAAGDRRALYLAWLGCVGAGELDDDVQEPPCPPGLGTLSAAQEALAAFLRVDEDLIAAAAAGSAAMGAPPADELASWVAALPESEKTSIIVRLLGGSEALLRGEVLQRLQSRAGHGGEAAVEARPRTVGELREAAEERAGRRRQVAAARAAREQARRDREAAAARERELTALAAREGAAWREVDALIATRKPERYDEAVRLLRDLRDVCERAGRQIEAMARIARLGDEYARRPSLIQRLRKAGLLG